MRLMQRDPFSNRRLAWLLVLVLLLPLAHTVASWHLLSHINAEQVSPSDGNHAIYTDHCDLCLTASTLTVGAPAVDSSAFAPVIEPAQAPRSRPSQVGFVRLQRLYESRAPPFALI